MNSSKILSLFVIITCLLTAGNTFAVTPLDAPTLQYSGNFDYQYSHTESGDCNSWKKNGTCDGYEPDVLVNDWSLLFSGITVGNVNGGISDSIYGANINIGNLYNSDNPGNLTFGSTPGGTGPVSFSITEGDTTYMTAELSNFNVVYDVMLDSKILNANFDLDNINNVIFDNGSSQYIDDLSTAYNNGSPINFSMDFTFTTGTISEDFTDDGTGQVAGSMVVTSAPAVAPEPVSSLLFLVGGVTMAFRRRISKK